MLSWVGHNIFGNMDGKVLDDPVNKANKVRSKDHLLTEILGYKPSTLVSIEYIEDMADWKTAWDHIHFRGFLDTQMTLQFTWQGCDSLLAAPLVLDLVRFTERQHRAGRAGVMTHLASFFKSPMGCDVPRSSRRSFRCCSVGPSNWPANPFEAQRACPACGIADRPFPRAAQTQSRLHSVNLPSLSTRRGGSQDSP